MVRKKKETVKEKKPLLEGQLTPIHKNVQNFYGTSPGFNTNPEFHQNQFTYLNANKDDEWSEEISASKPYHKKKEKFVTKKNAINTDTIEDINRKLMKQIQYLRRWRCACCGLSMLSSIISLAIVSYVIYTLFFRTPFSYITHSRVTHRPLFEKNQFMAMDISAAIYNPSFVPLTLNEVVLSVEFQGTDSTVKVLFETGNYTNSISAWSTTPLLFHVKADVNDYDALRIYALSTQPTTSVLVKGRFTLKLANILITQKVANYHCLQPIHFE